MPPSTPRKVFHALPGTRARARGPGVTRRRRESAAVATCDLHLHSVHSDGHMTVARLVDAVARAGRSAMALTDHDTVEGVAEAIAAGEARGLSVLSGVEISVAVPPAGNRHLLAYGFDPADSGLEELLARNRAARLERVERTVAALAGAGCSVGVDEVLAEAGRAAVGRPHVADALVRKGHARSRQEAFDRWLGDGKIGHVRKDDVASGEAMEAVRAAGGVTSLAHPGRRWDADLVMVLVRQGLDGLESAHPSHGAETRRRVEALAARFGLLATGGSDCHGDEDGLHALRRMRVPISVYDAVVARARDGAPAGKGARA